MGRQKASVSKQPIALGSPQKLRRKGRTVALVDQATLQVVHHIKEAGKHAHLQAPKTRKSYAGHVRRGCEWLEARCTMVLSTSTTVKGQGDSKNAAEEGGYDDPEFKNAFQHIPNKYSDKALALYLSWKGFEEQCSQSTIDGIRAAFKRYWDDAGDRFRGRWHYNDAQCRWEGNPVNSGEVNDILVAIKHKANADGAVRTHSVAMKKEYMECMLTWSKSLCPLDIAFHRVLCIITDSAPPSLSETLDMPTRTWITRHLEQLTFSATAWTLWTRNFELIKLKRDDVTIEADGATKKKINDVLLKYLRGEEHSLTLDEHSVCYEVHLRNRKGWQKKVDHGIKEIDLRRGDYIFPAVGSNGILQPGEPLSHDTVQKWINEATAGAKLKGSFTTHCFRRGATQYWFIHAPVGEQWSLSQVRWWGGWADNERMVQEALVAQMNAHYNELRQALGNMSNDLAQTLADGRSLSYPLDIRLEGEPRLGLHVPLRDWTYEDLHGINKKFQTKYYQRKVIAIEFLTKCAGDEAKFLREYGESCRDGHTKLLHAINAARERRGSIIRRGSRRRHPPVEHM
ncbi:hypothetical protein ID866_9259 [Astraeus odoratus]|nr:hypothetical protein ID866_9259 [Astraeus odoratus]